MTTQLALVLLTGAVLVLAIVAATLWACIVTRIDKAEYQLSHPLENSTHRATRDEAEDAYSWACKLHGVVTRLQGSATELLLRTDILAQDSGQEFYFTDPVEEKVKVIRKAEPCHLAMRKIDPTRKAS